MLARKWRACVFVVVISVTISVLHAEEQGQLLDNFWKQWFGQRLDLQTHEAQLFIREKARQWSPELIPAMIEDVITHEPKDGELRDYVYATAVTYIPDRKGCKEILAKIRASPQANQAIGLTDTEGDIAYDFQEAINNAESKEK